MQRDVSNSIISPKHNNAQHDGCPRHHRLKKHRKYEKKKIPRCYQEDTLWVCLNRLSQTSHVIHGPLAQLLAAYPADYLLIFLRVEFQSSEAS